MMFRRLYWVTEQVDREGHSSVIGVYTSIPDLIHHGLHWQDSANVDQLRISLTKLDSQLPPLGCWRSPDFHGLEEALQEFIATEEFSAEHCKNLVDRLSSFASSRV